MNLYLNGDFLRQKSSQNIEKNWCAIYKIKLKNLILTICIFFNLENVFYSVLLQ